MGSESIKTLISTFAHWNLSTVKVLGGNVVILEKSLRGVR